MTKIGKDTWCGLLFVAIAVGIGAASLNYTTGSPTRMGPGFFPLMAAVVLAALGLAIAVLGLRPNAAGAAAEDAPPFAWRPALLVLGSVVVFGATASRLGMAPSLFVTVLAASRAGDNTWRQSLLMSVLITALCALIFQIGLGLQLPLLGPWLGGR